MSDTTIRKCPDCKGAMKEIKIIDKTYPILHASLEYAVPGSKKSFWTGMWPIEGKVDALMCETCGRILLYGRPTGK
ncbi:MAG: hypothetical protein RLZZ135_927 [Cyanobacteriota bacterium]|jgi:hypothetical protein